MVVSLDAQQQRSIDEIVLLLEGRRFAVLTGAGVSTDSGIPDYRGEGAPVRSPMSISQFLDDPAYRARYWAGGHLGWQRFSTIAPNAGHRALARLEAAGHANGVVTQNVDGLHVRAGSLRVVDLHGSMSRVRCLRCGQSFAREAIAEAISAANPWLQTTDDVRLNPDGDVEVDDISRFTVPGCSVCGGMLKPEVVYFGELVPRDRFEAAAAIVAGAEAVLVAGSSLVVNTGIRLVEQARRSGKPVVIINRGPTRWDARADHKLDAGTSETLTELAGRLIR